MKRSASLSLIGLALLAFTQAAWSHAKPTQRTPAADAVVAAPSEVSIAFSETLEPALSSITVDAADGRAVSAAPAAVDARDGKRLRVKLPALVPGRYTVKWVAVAVDGHRTEGHYVFTVK